MWAEGGGLISAEDLKALFCFVFSLTTSRSLLESCSLPCLFLYFLPINLSARLDRVEAAGETNALQCPNHKTIVINLASAHCPIDWPIANTAPHTHT